jgi:hypothetical protein
LLWKKEPERWQHEKVSTSLKMEEKGKESRNEVSGKLERAKKQILP